MQKCAICLDWVVSDDLAIINPCGHSFHDACIVKWLGTFTTIARCPSCPICRTNIGSKQCQGVTSVVEPFVAPKKKVVAPLNICPDTIDSYYLGDDVYKQSARDWYGGDDEDDDAECTDSGFDSAEEYGYSREDYWGPCSSDEDEQMEEVDFYQDYSDTIVCY